MSIFKNYFEENEVVERTLLIQENLAEGLQIAKDKYKKNITELVQAAIDELIKTKSINLFTREIESSRGVPRTYRIKKKSYLKLEELKRENNNISIYTLVNIAVRNALISEGIIKEGK